MRVLVLSQYFWPENFGITGLVKSLQERGVEVTVLTGQPNYPSGSVFDGYSAWQTSRELMDGIPVLRVPVAPRGKKSGLRLAVNYLAFVASALVFGPWLLRRHRFDVVFVYAPSPLLQAIPAIFIAWLKRAPMVLWVQDLWPESLSATGFVRNARVLGWVGSVVRFIYRHTDLALIPSEGFRKPIEKLAPPGMPIEFYPNAVARSEPCSEPLSEPIQVLLAGIAGCRSVVFAGNLGAAQSLETILGAAEYLAKEGHEARFFLVGSGSLSDWLAEEIERRGLSNVSLPGRFPPETMPAIYEAASVLLVSLRDEPIFALTIPSKVQGYLAAGKPIIAALNGEGARLVEAASAGVTAPAGDCRALADRVIQIFGLEEAERREMGENGRQFAQRHFELDGLADTLVSRLDALTVKRRNSSP
ncbi:glycosyltransferase family 4 protein [Nitrogeniibacter mangrovi]|uniref:Glycosyltransferase family 4 protein n=1 Tax=Nitrogeniibacter mangrovi TaxID=2016596 RepID=A0A6C1B1Z0_9RHOO|nr:glycosyltransferase family 4 protein [Nitrogeniibacter mangrovi]QID16999.1 glycosyltransferase family 4 protein [Nitrogeniibacter mangrovi]